MADKLSGVIPVYKPPGMTSHDVVYKMKRLFGTKAGHTGTLDPAAAGVLPICLGAATKLSNLMVESDKEYKAEVIFGAETDTQDNTGNVVLEKPFSVDFSTFSVVVSSFAGEYSQIPPMYSAVKIKGKKLYELARKGVEITREPRTVFIREISVISADLPNKAEILVRCSKGTYIRTLCEDLGRRLNSAAHMGRLERTYAAGFSLDDTQVLEDITDESFIVPLSEIPIIKGYRHVFAKPWQDKIALNGGAVEYEQVPEDSERVLLHTSNGVLAGVFVVFEGKLKPFIMLV